MLRTWKWTRRLLFALLQGQTLAARPLKLLEFRKLVSGGTGVVCGDEAEGHEDVDQ